MPPRPRTALTALWRFPSPIPFASAGTSAKFPDLLLDDVDILLGNEEEVTMLFGSDSADDALEAAEETGLLVVMTRVRRAPWC